MGDDLGDSKDLRTSLADLSKSLNGVTRVSPGAVALNESLNRMANLSPEALVMGQRSINGIANVSPEGVYAAVAASAPAEVSSPAPAATASTVQSSAPEPGTASQSSGGEGA